MEREKLPVGIESFEEIRSEGFYYVDKTGLIRDLLGNWGKVNLFTRPRRFGKTLNMSMLKSFFEIGAEPALFDGLAISKEAALCETYMGKFPVVFVSLKGVDGLTFKQAIDRLKEIIGIESERFGFLLSSDKLSDNDKAKYAALIALQESLPLGYQTIVGEKGTKLSGGQKQRISIARVLIKDVPILVFDEATSALDFETEHNLYKAIRTHFREKTILIVTHRLDSIQFIDEIYVMRAGSVIEKGTHQELVSEHGLYYAILNNDVLVK